MPKIKLISVSCLLLALLSPLTILDQPVKHLKYKHYAEVAKETKYKKLVDYISKKYRRDPKLVQNIVLAAARHSNKKSFPNLFDTLAIIGIESSYRVNAVSYANARGVMQILYKKSSFDLDQNIKDGTWLLKDYQKRLKHPEKAIHAYNVGIGNFYRGVRNTSYVNKFNREKQELLNLHQEN